MKTATLQGLLGRKMRTALTALSIVLGVAMVSGTFILTDTMKKAFDDLFQGTYKNAGAVISGKEIVKGASKSTVPESLQTKVAALPDVKSASGAIFDISGTSDFVKLIGRDGKQLGSAQQPNFGWGFEPGEKANPTTLKSGKWAVGPSQVVIDAASAKKGHYNLGDKIGVAAEGPQRAMTVSGIARFGSVDSIGGATFAVFDVPTAQSLLRKQGKFDVIYVTPKSGVSQAEVADQVKPLLPASAQIETGDAAGKAAAQEVNDGLAFFQYLLLAFAGIALLVGSFVIFNTLSMTVSQRVRELATLRTLGASRKQVFRSVLLEGFITGLFAAIAGLFVGLLIAKGLNAMFKAFGVDLPTTGTVFGAKTVIVSLVLGVGITVLATISPARRATRVPPIAARQEPHRRADRARHSCCDAGPRRVRERPAHRRRRPAGRSWVHPAVHRRRHDLVAPGAAARGRCGRTGGASRGSSGCAGQGQRHAQSLPHGTYRRRADDRARAGHSRRDAGGEPQGHHQGRAEGSGAGGLRRDRQERL
jgi:putative ABC transport system permease protein